MASVQEPGSLEVVVRKPDGSFKSIKKAAVSWWGPGGSADGVPANTPEKWNFLPMSNWICGPGTTIEFHYTAAAADGIDASDCSFQLPIEVNGNATTLGNSAHAAGLGNDAFVVDLTFADITATVANQEVVVYKVRAKEGVVFRIGGDRTFISIEDDTA